MVITAARFRGRPVLSGVRDLGHCSGRSAVPWSAPCCRCAAVPVGATQPRWRGPVAGHHRFRWRLPLIRSGRFRASMEGGGEAIVLCWRPTPLLDSAGWSRLLLALAAVAERLDAPVRWLAFHQHQMHRCCRRCRSKGFVPTCWCTSQLNRCAHHSRQRVRAGQNCAAGDSNASPCPGAGPSGRLSDGGLSATTPKCPLLQRWPPFLVSLDLPNAATLEQQWCSPRPTWLHPPSASP